MEPNQASPTPNKSFLNQPPLTLALVGCGILFLLALCCVGSFAAFNYYIYQKEQGNFRWEKYSNQIDDSVLLPKPSEATDPIKNELEKKYKEFFPEDGFFIDNESFLGQAYNIQLTEKSKLAYPKKDHQLLKFCQSVQPIFDELEKKNSQNDKVYTPNTDIVITPDNKSEDDFNISCDTVLDTIKNTGSTSEALWYININSSQEHGLQSKLFGQRAEEDYASATKTGEELIKLNPSAPNYWDLAFTYYRWASLRGANEMANLKQAEANYKKATEVDAEFAPGYASLANIQQLLASQMKYTDEYDKMYEKSKQLDPGWSFAWMNKGIALSRVNRWNEGYAEQKKAVEVNPLFSDQPQVIRNYICIANHLGKKEPQEFYDKYKITSEMLKNGCS